MDLTPYTPRHSVGTIILIAVCSLVLTENRVHEGIIIYLSALVSFIVAVYIQLHFIKRNEFIERKKDALKKLTNTLNQTLTAAICFIMAISSISVLDSDTNDVVIAIKVYNLFNAIVLSYLLYLIVQVIKAGNFFNE